SSRTRERRSAWLEKSPPSPRRRAARGAGTGRTCRARTVPACSQSPSDGIISPRLDRIEPARREKEVGRSREKDQTLPEPSSCGSRGAAGAGAAAGEAAAAGDNWAPSLRGAPFPPKL